MLKIIILIFVIVLFVSAMLFFLKSMYHFYYMNTEVKSRKHDILRNLIPLLALSNNSYSEQGKKHLEMFSKNLLISFVHILIISIIYFAIGIK